MVYNENIQPSALVIGSLRLKNPRGVDLVTVVYILHIHVHCIYNSALHCIYNSNNSEALLGRNTGLLVG